MRSGSILSALLYGLLPASSFAAGHHLHRRHAHPVIGPPGDALKPIVKASVVPPPNNAIITSHATPSVPTPAAPKVVYPSELEDSSSASSTARVSSTSVIRVYTSSISTSIHASSASSYSSHPSSTKVPESKSESKSKSKSKSKTESKTIIKTKTTTEPKSKYKTSSAPTTFATIHYSSASAWNATITSSTLYSPTSTSTAAESSSTLVFPGGLKDPTLGQPCFNASCHNPSSDMNYRVTISVDDGNSGVSSGGSEQPLQGAAARIGMGLWGFLITVGVVVVAGL